MKINLLCASAFIISVNSFVANANQSSTNLSGNYFFTAQSTQTYVKANEIKDKINDYNARGGCKLNPPDMELSQYLLARSQDEEFISQLCNSLSNNLRQKDTCLGNNPRLKGYAFARELLGLSNIVRIENKVVCNMYNETSGVVILFVNDYLNSVTPL